MAPAVAALFHPHPDGEPNGGTLPVSNGWLGRVLDPLGRPLDGQGPLPAGPHLRRVRAAPPEATRRARLGPRLDVGVRALNCFATCRQGQRLGLFSGSGIGKSTLLAMLARHTACDVAVLALVGERGREVREFLEDDLGAAGLARSVVVVATSDSPPLLRRQAALCRHDGGRAFPRSGQVGAAADGQRHPVLPGVARDRPVGGRAAGHARLSAQRVRRTAAPAGARRPRTGPDRTVATGHITALFSVLVEGDDHNEPVADAVRGILDGHVVLDRRIAEGGRYPAVDVLRSLSRAVPGCNAPEENALTRRARALLALHADMADMVRLGAYRAGSDPAVDEAVALAPRIEAMLRQARDEHTGIEDSFALLRGGAGAAMTRDPLEALLRLRRMAADEARRGLAECLRIESEAAAAVAAIEAAIARETAAATSLAAGDAEVEAFAAWLRRIRPKQHAALAAEDEAETATVRARACSARHGPPCGRRRRCWRSTPPQPGRRRSTGRSARSTRRRFNPNVPRFLPLASREGVAGGGRGAIATPPRK